jgi:hypothetical protein
LVIVLHGRWRIALLNEELFFSLDQSRQATAECVSKHNKPLHSVLVYQTPVAFAAKLITTGHTIVRAP